jgi:hypothetical protein
MYQTVKCCRAQNLDWAGILAPHAGVPSSDAIATAALRDRRDRPWPLIGLGLLTVAGD